MRLFFIYFLRELQVIARAFCSQLIRNLELEIIVYLTFELYKHLFVDDSLYNLSLFSLPLTDLMTMELTGDLQQKQSDQSLMPL